MGERAVMLDTTTTSFETLLAAASERLRAGSEGGTEDSCEDPVHELALETLAPLGPGATGWVEPLAGLLADRRDPRGALGERLEPWLVGEIGLLLKLNPMSGEDLERASGLAARFVLALRPRKLHRLRHAHRRTLMERLETFATNAEDSKFAARARVVLAKRAHLGGPALDHFIATLGLDHLRTLPDAVLLEVAAHFITWNPLVELLARPQGQGAPSAVQDELAKLITSTKRILAAQHGAGRREDIEDAVQEVLLRIVESQGDPALGYSYEVPFPAWFAHSAVFRLRALRAGTARDQVDEGESRKEGSSGSGEHPLSPSLPSRLEDWQEAYLLAETTFRDPTQVLQIWRALLASELGLGDGQGGAAPDDAALAARLGIPLGSLRTLRRTLRQRAGAVRFVREVVPQGHADAAGDESLLSWVRSRWGLASADVVTLRKLAALARASGGERTLGWAILARWVVEGNNGANWAHWKVVAERLVRERSRPQERTPPRLERCTAWKTELRYQNTLHVLKGHLQRLALFLAPCWLLVRLRGIQSAAALDGLQPAAGERAAVEATARALEAAP